jgi:DNA-binding transcriptional MocR family regulator
MHLPGLQIDGESSVPVYRQIADGVRAAAEDGRLQPGRRLPPTRDLARQLGVNRQTVVAAYEYLAAEGWVQSHTGKGTYLVEPPGAAGQAPAATAGGDAEWSTSFSRAVEGPNVGDLLSVYRMANAGEGISFAGSYPSRDLMPVEAFGHAMTAALHDAGRELLSYGPTAGHAPLREMLAETLGADPENVLITNGAQQAIELVFHTFLERGEAVIIEEPTYAGVLSVVGSIGARAVAVPVDEQGMRPDLLAIALERHRPRLLYVQPTFHNPTTGVMDQERRRQLLALAARNRCIVVEDDWASGLRFEGRDVPTLYAMDGGAHVIYLSTFSKKLLPGLRVGWIAAPPSVTERLMRLKQIRDCGTSPLLQAALHVFLCERGLERHLERVLPANRERRDCMLRALERHAPAGVGWTRPEGGLFLWVTLPAGLDGRELFLAAQERGVRYSSGELFHSNAGRSHSLRLTYSTATPSEIEKGVEILGALIRERWPADTDPRERKPVQTMPVL